MFAPDTVDSIVGQFSRTVVRLQALADKCSDKAVYNAKLAEEYATASKTHLDESARATKITNKINKLLTDE